MAGGNKGKASLAETRAYFESLHPDAQKQHATRIDGSHLAALEMLDAMGPPPEYGNLDGTVYGTGSDTPVLESADPIDALQDLYAAQNNAQSNPDRSYRDMSQGAQDARGVLASVNTGTSGEPPVLAAGPDRSGSNRLTNLLSGLTYDALGYLTGTSAEAVKANGISLRVDGDEFFAFDGENTVPIDAKTAEAIDAANNDAGELPSMQDAQRMMDINNPLGSTGGALTDTNTGNGTGNTVVTKDNGALTVPSKPTQSTVRSTTGGYTGNARGSDLPDMQIGLNERLMRMGAAGLAAGGQGSLAQMGAMFGASADVNQANRQAEMEAFGIEEERRQAHAARVATLAASKNKGAGGGDMSKLKDFQAKNFGFYNRGVQAEKALLEVGDIGTDVFELLKSNVPLIGNNLVDPKFQRYDQARRNFVNAVLRRESGAVISDDEFENANIQYFPQPFDSAETIAQKQQNRRATMEGIRMGAGPSIFYTPTYPMSVPTDQGGGASDQETEDLVKKYTN